MSEESASHRLLDANKKAEKAASTAGDKETTKLMGEGGDQPAPATGDGNTDDPALDAATNHAVREVLRGEWLPSSALDVIRPFCVPGTRYVDEGMLSDDDLFERVDALRYNAVILPLNHSNTHWTVAVIQSATCKISHYDSAPECTTDAPLARLRNLLQTRYERTFEIVHEVYQSNPLSLAVIPPSKHLFYAVRPR